MPQYTMDMVLEWAKIFPENADMGDPDGGKAAKKVASIGGQTSVNAYFTDQSQIDQLLADGLDPRPLNNDRIKEGEEAFRIGKYMKITRGLGDNIKVFSNKKGETEVNFGGAPKVVDLRDPDNRKMWSYEEDGSVGNGSVAKVNFEVHSKGAGVRLKNVGIMELVEYEMTESSSPDWLEV